MVEISCRRGVVVVRNRQRQQETTDKDNHQKAKAQLLGDRHAMDIKNRKHKNLTKVAS